MTQMAQDYLAVSKTRSAEVIVVGAGVSGLQTARKLQQAGISCIVLEGSGNIGGQTFAHSNFTAANHPRTYAIATECGILDEHQPIRGKAMLEGFDAFEHDDQPALAAEDAACLFQIQAILDTLSKRWETSAPSMTMAELVSSYGATPAVANLANMWTRTIFGLSSNNVSASQFLSHCASCGGLLAVLDNLNSSSEQLYIPEVSHKVASALAKRLNEGTLHLHQKVTQIEHTSSNGCVIHTASGDVFRSTKVVLAGSLSMFGELQVHPTITAAEKWEMIRNEQGFSTTVDVVFDQAWWQDRGLSGYAYGLTGPIAQVRPSGIEIDGLCSLSCQIAGEQARGMWLWLMDAEERETLIMQHLSTIFGGNIPRPVQMIEQDANPLLHGQQCLTYTCGMNAAGAATCQASWTTEGNIHISGTDTSSIWRGHMEGALTAGERTAIDIVAAFSTSGVIALAPRL